MSEIWVDVKGYEGSYKVSNFGFVKSLDRMRNSKLGAQQMHRGQFCRPNEDARGYLRVSLNKDCTERKGKLHRVVAENFIENPLNKPEVNHKDGDKKNNHVSNLEWVTRLENLKHAHELGLYDVNKKHSIEKIRKIKTMILDGVRNKDICKEHNVSQQLVCDVKHGRRWVNA